MFKTSLGMIDSVSVKGREKVRDEAMLQGSYDVGLGRHTGECRVI